MTRSNEHALTIVRILYDVPGTTPGLNIYASYENHIFVWMSVSNVSFFRHISDEIIYFKASGMGSKIKKKKKKNDQKI